MPETSIPNAQVAWTDECYSVGCMKRVLTKSPTLLERQAGQLEQVIGEVLMRKDRPGVFYDAHGNQVSEELARQAGFPVERLKREGEKQRRLAEARAKIEAEFAEQQAAIEAEPAAYTVSASAQADDAA